MPKIRSEIPEPLKPYEFHGLDLTLNNSEAFSDCPFCGREGKFSVNITTSQFKCWVCKTSGNSLVFLRKLWELFRKNDPSSISTLSEERGFRLPQSAIDWGICRSSLTGEWLVPAFNLDGTLCQLSRYVKTADGMKLYATPGFKHGIYGLNLFHKKFDQVFICEGPWDGVAWYEALGMLKENEEGFSLTSSTKASIRASCNVIAVPSCTVFNESWVSLFDGKTVSFLFDNDHPRWKCGKCDKTRPLSVTGCPCGATNDSEEIPPGALEGVKRNAKLILGNGSPEAVEFLRWGPNGYDLELPSGTDIRDRLKGVEDKKLASRVSEILEHIESVPPEWLEGVSKTEKDDVSRLEIIACDKYREVELAWRKAMKWTSGLNAALSVMLASSLSTNLVGEQLWVKIIGPPSCGKTTILEGLATCVEYVLSKDTIRGFYSGWKSEDGEDHSIASQARGKTLAIKDGDTLLKAPNLHQILSEARGLYDRVGRTAYRNNVSHEYPGHRMGIIICGTASLREIDESELGARFVDCVVMDDIDEEFEDEVSWRAVNQEARCMLTETTEDSDSQYPPDLAKAMQMTGGYVKYLRENASALISQVEADEAGLKRCAVLGKFVAFMRARPVQDVDEASREFSARLSKQFTRLAYSLAAARNKTSLDHETLQLVTKVALDTSRGLVFNIVRQLFSATDGLESKTVALYIDAKEDRVRTMLRFMKKLGIVETFKLKEGSQTPRWRLTAMMRRIFHLAMGEG